MFGITKFFKKTTFLVAVASATLGSAYVAAPARAASVWVCVTERGSSTSFYYASGAGVGDSCIAHGELGRLAVIYN